MLRMLSKRVDWLGLVTWERKDAGDWVSACRNMAIVGNARKGRSKKKWNEVVKDDLKWKAQDMGKTSDPRKHGKGT